jgi:hypothetical protein
LNETAVAFWHKADWPGFIPKSGFGPQADISKPFAALHDGNVRHTRELPKLRLYQKRSILSQVYLLQGKRPRCQIIVEEQQCQLQP